MCRVYVVLRLRHLFIQAKIHYWLWTNNYWLGFYCWNCLKIVIYKFWLDHLEVCSFLTLYVSWILTNFVTILQRIFGLLSSNSLILCQWSYLITDPLQISPLILREFKPTNEFLFTLKSSENNLEIEVN